MGRRIRLTHKSRRAVEDSTPFPGDVGNPGRPYKRRDQYDNWQEVDNHPLPDMRHEWQDNPRDEIGFGIPNANRPTVASVRLVASKRVRLAVLLLGDKCPEEVIEDQARDFFSLSEAVTDRTLARFADTQDLYKGTQSDEDEDQDEAAEEDNDKEASEEKSKEDSEEKSKEDSEEESKEDSEEESKEAAEEKSEEAAEEKSEEESKEASEEKSKEDSEEESKEAAEEESEEESKEASEEESKESSEEESKEAAEEKPKEAEKSENVIGEIDIELKSMMSDEPEADPAVDAKLAQLFETEKSEESTQKVEASEKQGVKKLGGQPRVASKEASTDLSQIWKDAPDVSSVFE